MVGIANESSRDRFPPSDADGGKKRSADHSREHFGCNKYFNFFTLFHFITA